MLRTAADYLFIVAVVVASRPYLEFLAVPPEGSGERWAVTIIALATAVALRLYMRQKDERDRRDLEDRQEAQRRAMLERR